MFRIDPCLVQANLVVPLDIRMMHRRVKEEFYLPFFSIIFWCLHSRDGRIYGVSEQQQRFLCLPSLTYLWIIIIYINLKAVHKCSLAWLHIFIILKNYNCDLLSPHTSQYLFKWGWRLGCDCPGGFFLKIYFIFIMGRITSILNLSSS